MKIDTLLSVAMLGMAVMLSSCATATHIMVGQARTPINPGEVRIYLEPPDKYEVIAIIDVESSGMTYQGEKDLAVSKLKEHAATLGANGVLLDIPKTETAGYVGGVSGATLWAAPSTYTALSAKAIYVQPNEGR